MNYLVGRKKGYTEEVSIMVPCSCHRGGCSFKTSVSWPSDTEFEIHGGTRGWTVIRIECQSRFICLIPKKKKNDSGVFNKTAE